MFQTTNQLSIVVHGCPIFALDPFLFAMAKKYQKFPLRNTAQRL